MPFVQIMYIFFYSSIYIYLQFDGELWLEDLLFRTFNDKMHFKMWSLTEYLVKLFVMLKSSSFHCK